MIAGLETQEEHNTIMDAFGLDDSLYPSIIINYNYFDPQPFTPLADFDIRNKIEIDREVVFHYANKRNKRIRTLPIKYIAHSTWRTIYQRAKSLDEAEFAHSFRNEKDNKKIIASCENEYPHLLGHATLEELLAVDRRKYNTPLTHRNEKDYAGI